MKIASAAFGSLVWLVVAPGTVCGLVPWLITDWQRPADPLALVDGLGASWSSVALRSCCTPSSRSRGRAAGPRSAAPTERLVVSGAYRFVRNPMYVAVVALVLGQVLLFASWALLAYLVLITVVTDAFVRTYEEPTLRETYGPEYDEYRAAVPRWLPRLTPWRGTTQRVAG